MRLSKLMVEALSILNLNRRRWSSKIIFSLFLYKASEFIFCNIYWSYLDRYLRILANTMRVRSWITLHICCLWWITLSLNNLPLKTQSILVWRCRIALRYKVLWYHIRFHFTKSWCLRPISRTWNWSIKRLLH